MQNENVEKGRRRKIGKKKTRKIRGKETIKKIRREK
jgi:hypothetical protein